MFDIFIFALNAVLPLILVISLGYWLKKRKLLTREFTQIGNKLVFRILLPVYLFTNIAKMEDFTKLRFDIVIFSVGMIFLIFLAGCLLSMTTRDPKQKGVLIQCTFRSNFALIGVPLAQLIVGDAGVVSAAILSAFTIPFYNILAVIALSIFVTGQENKSVSQQIKGILHNILHNPLIISVLAGILVACVKPAVFVLPEFIINFAQKLTFVPTTLSYLSRTSTPMALLVLGAQFEFSSVKELRHMISVGLFGRLLLAPFIGISSAIIVHKLGILTFDSGYFAALIALFGTPAAVSSAIMAEEMGSDGQLAGQLVVWSTLLSSFVIFFLIILFKGMGLL